MSVELCWQEPQKVRVSQIWMIDFLGIQLAWPRGGGNIAFLVASVQQMLQMPMPNVWIKGRLSGERRQHRVESSRIVP